MNQIHRAGVRHRDIRPENMIIHNDGTISIIDFDRAMLGASARSQELEMKHLLNLLDGDCESLGTHYSRSRSFSGSLSDWEGATPSTSSSSVKSSGSETS